MTPIDYAPLELVHAELEYFTRMSYIRKFQYKRTQSLAVYVQYLALQNEIKRLKDQAEDIVTALCPKHGNERKKVRRNFKKEGIF